MGSQDLAETCIAMLEKCMGVEDQSPYQVPRITKSTTKTGNTIPQSSHTYKKSSSGRGQEK